MWDVIVIGAGHNGLIAACYLARAGQRVLVLERREIVGGACVTEEVWPGYHVSTGAYLCSLLMPEVVRDLELERHGFKVYRRETSGFAPFLDGTSLTLYPNEERTREELKAFCADTPEDVEAFFRFEAEVARAADILEPLMTPDTPTFTPNLETIREAFQSQGVSDLFDAFVCGSVRELLDDRYRFRSEKLKAVLATDGLIGTYGGPSTPGTAYVLLHHYMGRILGGRGSWGYVRGGMGSITKALAASLIGAGGTIRTGVPVARILTEPTGTAYRVVGVELLDGERIEAPIVLSNADPYHTFETLLCTDPVVDSESAIDCESLSSESLSSEFFAIHSVQNGNGKASPWRTLKSQGGASVKINLAVTQLPEFSVAQHLTPSSQQVADPRHLGTVHLCPDLDYLERAWDEARRGYPSTEPMIEIYMQSATDPTLAPKGGQMLSMFVQYFPYNLAPGLDLDTERNRFTKRVFAIVERYAPGFTASVLHRQTLTPRDLEARFGLTGGHIFHGDLLPPNLWDGRSNPPATGASTPVLGLYLCGSGAHPGGCVYGAPGYNAAKAVIAFLHNSLHEGA